MKKLIFMDIDGTLVDGNRQVSVADRQAISQAIDQGDLVYVATGRKYSAAKEVAQLVHPEIKVVASNGCVYETEDELFIEPLKSESLEAIYQTVNEAQLSLFFFGLEKTFFTDELPAYFVAEDRERLVSKKESQLSQIRHTQDLLAVADQIVNGIVISENDLPLLQRVKEKLATIDDLTISSSFINNLELIPKNMSKAVAIKKIQEHHQISSAQTITFGDGMNDVEMFAASDISVAMGNASDQVKAHAQFTTLSNTENGISHFLTTFYKGVTNHV